MGGPLGTGEWVVAKAPATSANLGPGFDALGVALDWWETVECALAPEGLAIDVSGPGRQWVPTDEGNLVARAVRAVGAAAGLPPAFGLRLRLSLALPVGRGLGSSAAAVAAGLVAANRLLGEPLPVERLLDLGTAIEGHPDNVAPALLGGFCAACPGAGRTRTLRLDPPAVDAVLAIPDRPLPTELARRALPAHVPFADAVANVQRTALLVAAVATGRVDLLAEATEDRLHQPYRAPLVPGLLDCIEAARAAGALGACLSGAGPSVLAWVPQAAGAPRALGGAGAAVAAALAAALEGMGGGVVRVLRPSARGAWAAPRGVARSDRES